MQRMFGLAITIAGAALALWGAFYVMTGQSGTRLELYEGYSISAISGGLAGVALITVGLIWVRD